MMDGKNFQIVTKNTTIPQNVEMDIIASAYIYIYCIYVTYVTYVTYACGGLYACK